jgi:hypothetical protein
MKKMQEMRESGQDRDKLKRHFAWSRPGPVRVALLALLLAPGLHALVNPSLQPIHLHERYKIVLSGKVVAADLADTATESGQIRLQVSTVAKGEFASQEIIIDVPAWDDRVDPKHEANEEWNIWDVSEESRSFVAFIGKKRRGGSGAILLYCGDTQWHHARISDKSKPGAWTYEAASAQVMVGTFNGAAERLAEMMLDARNGTAFFPPDVSVRLNEDITVGTLPGEARGVALFDLDGDGDLDVLGCSPQGIRAYLQNNATFTDATAQLGLAGISGISCSLADTNADGHSDLLIDTQLFRGTGKRFAKATTLQAAADALKVAAFVQLNGDGHPDILLSRTDGGLTALLNDGKGAFRDATSTLGLDTPACGADGNGYFAPGDWNDDGRTDLYYATGKGLILLQDATGTFAPLAHSLSFDYRCSPDYKPGKTGAGCFGAIWRQDSMDIACPADSTLGIVADRQGELVDISDVGNEIALCAARQIATLVADLNMDGYADLYTISRDANQKNQFHANRGYGSFMDASLYDADAFGDAHLSGAWGAASGDANGDGMNDLLLGHISGEITLIMSGAAELRKPTEHPTYHAKKLQQTSILSVTLRGRGTLGADLRLLNSDDKTVLRRSIGTQVLTGCRGPNSVNLAVREPGDYTLRVRFADGAVKTSKVSIGETKRLSLSIANGEK